MSWGKDIKERNERKKRDKLEREIKTNKRFTELELHKKGIEKKVIRRLRKNIKKRKGRKKKEKTRKKSKQTKHLKTWNDRNEGKEDICKGKLRK